MFGVVQSIFGNMVLLGVLKTMAQESDVSGFNWLGEGETSHSIIEFLIAKMIRWQNNVNDTLYLF